MENKNSSRSQLSLKSSSRKNRDGSTKPKEKNSSKTRKSYPCLAGELKTPDSKHVPSLYKKVLTVNAKNVLHHMTPQLQQDSEEKIIPSESSHCDSFCGTSSLTKSPVRRKSSNDCEFHCSFDESDEENNGNIPLTQPLPTEKILEGVIAFIEVRSNSENRFGGISKQMKALGATITEKFTADVTHVVFKDGKKSTREKALKKGIHLVSVLWVESCRVECKRVSEDLFPIINLDESHTPLVVGRLKRTKSMQPKAFEEDVRNSAERGKRKRRKVLEEQKKTPISKVYVQETQEPFSPTMIGPSPSLHLVPDTPTGPSERSYRVSSESNSDTESIANDLLSKRLDFGLDCLSDEESGSNEGRNALESRKSVAANSKVIQGARGSSSTNRSKDKMLSKRPTHSITEQETPDLTCCAPRDVLLSGSAGLKRKKSKSSSSNEDTGNVSKKKKAKTKKKTVKNASVEEPKDFAKNRTQSLSSEYGHSSGGENKSQAGGVPNGGKKTAGNKCKKKPKKMKSGYSQQATKEADNWTDCSDSGVSVDGCNSNSTNSAKDTNKHRKIQFKRTAKVLSENKSSTEEESTEDEEARKPHEDTKQKVTKKLGKIGKRSSSKVKPKHSIVMTSMHFEEQDIVLSVVRKLGGFFIAEKVNQSTTHVVSGSGRRTLNVLMAIAQGCWLVSSEWAMKSLEAGFWVDEEPYELYEDFPSAQLCRLERASSGPDYQQDLFKHCPLMFLSEDTSPPPDALMTLILKCGGKISTSIRKAGICVGSITRRTQGINVSERWVLDSITEHSVQPYHAYALNTPAKKQQTSPSY